MRFSLILISHERNRDCTVKTVYGLDAVLARSSYISALTNKEETFTTLRYELSATEWPERCLSGVYHAFCSVSAPFPSFSTALTVLFIPTKGPKSLFWPLEEYKTV